MEFVDGMSLYRGYMGLDEKDPWGLFLSWWDEFDFDKMDRLPALDGKVGKWHGDRGNSVFEFSDPIEWMGDKNHRPKIPFVNGEPVLGDYVYKVDIPGVRDYAIADIDYASVGTEKQRRKIDFDRANEFMKSIDPNWQQPKDWTWHHVNVSSVTGKGQLVLVPTGLHGKIAHMGSFSYWTKVLAAKAARNTTALAKLANVSWGSYARKGLSVGFKSLPYGIGLLFMMPSVYAAGQEDGTAGIAAVVGREVVLADLAEGSFNVVVYPYLEQGGNAYADWHAGTRRAIQSARFRGIGEIDRKNMIRVDRLDLPKCWKDLYGTPYNPTEGR